MASKLVKTMNPIRPARADSFQVKKADLKAGKGFKTRSWDPFTA